MASKKKTLAAKTSKNDVVESNVAKSNVAKSNPVEAGVAEPEVTGADSKVKRLQTTSFPIVGIGASAGGYEACSQLLKYLPVDTGMAFIVVQHLHPDHDSALTGLLGRATSMPVVEITDSVLVEPNTVYIIPPNAELEIFHGKLQLSMRDRTIPHLPIDHFMRSLADDQGSKAIGIILSGTASDGVMGLKAIKAGGGITISQDETSAKYKGMPHSAIVAGCVDMILPPDKMAMELAYIAHHPFLQMGDVNKFGLNTKNLLEDKSELDKLFLLLRKATGIDFTYYKMPTLQRRISRRMILHKLSTIKDYVDYMLAHNDEIQALYQDILINVTEFFRDTSAFESLKEVIFPKIISSENGIETLRIWIPGCSTGEEVYSMAILVMEYLDQFSPIGLQIFATDIDEEAIEKARQGRYKESISENVSEERLKRFFNKVDDGYQVKKSIRDFCIFARQNVFKDPPFSRINLISCRNMLIYLGPVLQKRILSIFHYSLVPNGVLFLGSAETIGEHTHLFQIIDQKNKFYSKKSLATPLNLDFSPPLLSVELDSELDVQVKKYEPWNGIDLQQKVDRIIMQKYTPAAVVINDQMKILQFRGHTGRFLEPAQGTASLNIIKMVREELLLYLRSLIQKAIETHTFVRKEKLQYHYNGNVEFVTIEITPIQHPTALDFCYLVVFEDFIPRLIEIENDKKSIIKVDKEAEERGETEEIHSLTQELAATREYLQSVIEQQEASNEELRSANEEIQSSNEELQSINEELETAKEELQSTNEELATVNEELETRNGQLARLNDDYSNFINSLNIAFLTVDRNLHIRNFTPKIKEMMSIIDSDIGRPITDIKLKVVFPEIESMIMECIKQVKNIEYEFKGENDYWYSARIRPYRTGDNRIDGAVVAFVDVNDIKLSLEKASKALEYVESIVSVIHHPLLVLDKNLRVVSASQAYYENFGVTDKETVGNLVNHLGNGEWAIPKLRKELEHTLKSGEPFNNFTVTHELENHRLIEANVFGRKIPRASPEENMILMQIEMTDS